MHVRKDDGGIGEEERRGEGKWTYSISGDSNKYNKKGRKYKQMKEAMKDRQGHGKRWRGQERRRRGGSGKSGVSRKAKQ